MYHDVDRWVPWIDVPPNPKDRGLEDSMCWSPGTIEVLRCALNLNFDRYTGWICPDKPQFRDAGRYYKHGVAVNEIPGLPTGPPIVSPVQLMPNIELLQPVISGNRFMVFGRSPYIALAGYIKGGCKLEPAGRAMALEGLDDQSKTLQVAAFILKNWREAGKSMKWTVIGGGATTDIAGFAAACVGAEMDLVPTTLLGMVDAAIGGKTGVNAPPNHGINQIGTLYFPKNVIICPQWLATSRQEDWQAGSWACVKHALLINDEQLLDEWLEKVQDKEWLENRRQKSWGELVMLIARTLQVKVQIISADPYEIHDLRLLLHLGHTLAHALEGIALDREKRELLHGEALGVGLIYAILLSEKLGKISKPPYLPRLLAHHGLLSKQQLASKLGVSDLASPPFFKLLMSFFKRDKKYRSAPRWVVLRDKANEDGIFAELVSIKDPKLLQECWHQLLATIR